MQFGLRLHCLSKKQLSESILQCHNKRGMNMSGKKQPNERLCTYALYNTKDDCVFVGSVRQIANYLKVPEKRVRNYYARHLNLKREYTIVKIEEE